MVQRVGVREFKDHASSYFRSGETVMIERRGKLIGVFVPFKTKDPKAARLALDRFGQTVRDLLEETGLTEEELVKEFLPRRRSGG